MWNGPSSAVAGRDHDHEAQSIREHRQLLTCIQDRDSLGAREAMRAHLERSMQNILSSFRRTQRR